VATGVHRFTSDRRTALELVGFGTPRALVDGAPIAFPTQHAAKALFCLALSPGGSLDVLDLGERLWPDAPLSRLSSRVATMTWQLRRTLGDHGSRVTRTPAHLSIDLSDVDVDVLAVRREASGMVASRTQAAAPSLRTPDRSAVFANLQTPLLAPWADEAWVIAERLFNASLASQLLGSGAVP